MLWEPNNGRQNNSISLRLLGSPTYKTKVQLSYANHMGDAFFWLFLHPTTLSAEDRIQQEPSMQAYANRPLHFHARVFFAQASTSPPYTRASCPMTRTLEESPTRRYSSISTAASSITIAYKLEPLFHHARVIVAQACTTTIPCKFELVDCSGFASSRESYHRHM